jgi:biopolymer transport protein ExbD
MVQTKRFFDVWIVESNTVYKEVPFTVVTDWMQQGRLLAADKAKPSGTADWQELGKWPEMAAFLPQADEHRAEDVAEALEPVELEMAWRRPSEDDDQDVDMIPLIDVSLVLLIFFMMTSTVSGLAGPMGLPEVRKGATNLTSDPFWISIELDKDKQPIYSLGQGGGAVPDSDKNLDFPGLLRQLDEKLQTLAPIELLTIRGDKSIESGVIKQLRAELGRRREAKKINKIGDTVVEKQGTES